MEGKIIILAAGKGTRIGAVDKPKVLLELAGRPMIEHLISHIVGRPIVVIGFGAEQVKKQLGDRVDYAIQTEQLGTGHAVASAKELLKDFTAIIHSLAQRRFKLFLIFTKKSRRMFQC